MKVRAIISISILCAAFSTGNAQDTAKVRSFRFRGMELRSTLDSLMRWYGVPLIYLDNDVAGKRVDAECTSCTFAQAIDKVLEGQGLVGKNLGSQIVLRTAEVEPEAPTATFAGTLRDSLTGQAIGDANVLLMVPAGNGEIQDTTNIYRWCFTNQFGFFSLRNIQPGNYVLSIRRVGYRMLREALNIPRRAMVGEFSLSEQHVSYPEITVEGHRSGLTAAEEVSQGVYIRGTPSDDNQYLLEGARIYNPLHFAGVMSSFNGDALRDVQVVAGGVPPYYGGPIGGILDVALRDGSLQGLSGSAGVGSLGSNLLVEGPIAQRTSFVISARRGYPDVFYPRGGTTEPQSDLNSTEIMAKLSRELPGSQQISLTGYFGRDAYERTVSGISGDQLNNSLQWGNASANLQWIGIVSPSLFFHSSVIYTNYGFNVEQNIVAPLGGIESFPSDYRIQDATIKAHAEYFYDEYHTVLAGVDLTRHWLGGKISDFASQIAPMSFDGISPWDLSVYFEDQWRLVPSVSARLGARATSFIGREGSFSVVDPRFSLLASIEDDLSFYSSLSAINQFVHEYRQSGIFMFYPSVFFYPSTETVRPSTSLEVSLGLEKTFDEDGLRLAVESYYRTTQKLHEFLFDTAASMLMDALILGEGNVYGADVTIDKRLGRFTGSLRYSFSWASDRFAELNGGTPFRPRFDRRHELYATLSYQLGDYWTGGIDCLLSSNQFPSFAPNGLKAPQDVVVTRPTTNGRSLYAEPYDLNGGRLPGFQRLELRLLHAFSWWGLPVEATLCFVNGYGLVDPFVWELRRSPDVRSRWRVTFDASPLVPLYPVVGLSARF